MRRTIVTGLILGAAAFVPRLASAAPPAATPIASAAPPAATPIVATPAPPAATPIASAAPPAPALHASPARGVAVVALPGAADATWPLALGVYGELSLRPPILDDAHARVLAGEHAPPGAPADVRDLADTVAALRGDDAPSRTLLAEIARKLGVAAVVIVHVDAGRAPEARVFVADTRDFDAATYTMDPAPGSGWSGAVRSLTRTFGPSPAPSAAPVRPEPSPVPPPAAIPPAPAAAQPSSNTAGSRSAMPVPTLATHDATKPSEHKGSRPFYLSPWFWGALGVAALAGGGAYLLSRDTSAPTIHLQVEGPPQ